MVADPLGSGKSAKIALWIYPSVENEIYSDVP